MIGYFLHFTESLEESLQHAVDKLSSKIIDMKIKDVGGSLEVD